MVVDGYSLDEITEIMETGLPLNVPTKVDCELGDNWGEAG